MPLSSDTQKIIQEQFKVLPKDVQSAILAVDLRKKLQTITEKHRLHLDQAGVLETETLFIMLGLEHPKDYIANITRELHIDAEHAKKIAVDINEQIFRPIRESLKKIHNIGEESGEQKVESSGASEQTHSHTELGKIIYPEIKKEIADTKKDEDSVLRLKKETPPVSSSSGQTFPPLQTYTKEIEPEQGERPLFLKIIPEATKGPEFEMKVTHQEKIVPPPENLPVETTDEKIPPLSTYLNADKSVTPQGPIQKIEIMKQEERFPAQVLKTLIPKDSIGEKLSRPFTIPRTETEYKEKTLPEIQKKEYGGGDPYREPVK
ncbi:MAG: hypothetical protein Q8R36_02730 [bacterium]|nr:hypothetical protein [bacterium]